MYIQISIYTSNVYLLVFIFATMKRDDQLLIRLSTLEKEGFEKASEIAGIGLSAWARERLRTAAIQELQSVGEKIVFLNPIPINKKENGKKH